MGWVMRNYFNCIEYGNDVGTLLTLAPDRSRAPVGMAVGAMQGELLAINVMAGGQM